MADTVRTYAALQTLLADNVAGAISPQDVRDFLASVFNWVNGVAGGAGDISFSGGKVGINCTPLQRLSIKDAYGDPATTGTTQAGILRLRTPSDGCLDFGEAVSAPYPAWLQHTSAADLSLEYPLALNPNGGNVSIGLPVATASTAVLDVNTDILRLRTAKTPATAGAAGNAGDHCWDASNIYVCVATNTWKKIGIATW